MDKKEKAKLNSNDSDYIRKMTQQFEKKVEEAKSTEEFNAIHKEWHESVDDLQAMHNDHT
ncbi:hypothetical protein ACFLU6_11540 [Acidobacteriota bacterium]